jgi:putative salt-induced outer membrane protein YdiY
MRFRTRAGSLVAALVVMAAAPALSAEDAPKSPWSGSAELSYVATDGNTDTQTVGFGGELHYKPGVWSWDLKASYVESESDGVTNAERTTLLAGASRTINSRLDYYARVGYLANEFAGIDSNWSGETGLSYKLLTGEEHVLDVGGGVGYTAEERTTGEDREFATGSAFGRYKWKFSKTAELAEEATFLYDFEDSDNWRFMNSLSVSAAINSLFTLKAYYNVVHLNDPVPGFEETDGTTGLSLVAKF